jgi:hypothetical protein
MAIKIVIQQKFLFLSQIQVVYCLSKILNNNQNIIYWKPVGFFTKRNE